MSIYTHYVKHNVTGRVWKVTGTTYQPKTGWTLYMLESPDGVKDKAKKDSFTEASMREAAAAGFIILDQETPAPKGEATTADKGKLIERIQKLLRLAQNAGATEAEAQSAMGKVHELLAEHNLTMSVIENHGSKEKDEVLGKQVRRTNKNGKWECFIYRGAAELNFCNYISASVVGSSDITHLIIGTEVNVLAAEMLGDYLRDTVNRMARNLDMDSIDIQKALIMDGIGEAMFRHKFKQGAAIRLDARCLELKKQRSQASTKTSDGRNLPALLSTYEQAQKQNEAFIKDEIGKTRQTKQRVKGSHGLGLGKQAADTINLDPQVGSSHQSKARRLSNG